MPFLPPAPSLPTPANACLLKAANVHMQQRTDLWVWAVHALQVPKEGLDLAWLLGVTSNLWNGLPVKECLCVPEALGHTGQSGDVTYGGGLGPHGVNLTSAGARG